MHQSQPEEGPVQAVTLCSPKAQDVSESVDTEITQQELYNVLYVQ